MSQSISITTLPNRIFFNEATNKALMQAQRHHKNVALLLIDIDKFQEIKKTHGPKITHTILEGLSKRLRALLRGGDTLAHLENDEFAVLLTDVVQAKSIGRVAEKLLKAGAEPFRVGAVEITLTLSIGIAMYPDNGQTLEELQTQLANALYQAKHQGGNAYQFTTPHQTMEAHTYTQFQDAIRLALKNQEFVLHYQAKLDLKAWALSGFEALIRWQHPMLGLIDPFKFIPTAEESGVILDLGEWALRQACATTRHWQQEEYQIVPVAVNLSPKQLYQPGLVDLVKKILQESQLDARYLELEITEFTVMNNREEVDPVLRGLKDLGISLAIDDFGTGHTSITYLRDFPINTVKIDKLFTQSLPGDEKNAAFISAIITLAHQLGIKIVAEGIESMEQARFLAEMGCDHGQGYFISRPLPESKVIAQMNRGI